MTALEPTARAWILLCLGSDTVSGNVRSDGYYTLSVTALRLSDLPEARQKKLPRYSSIPCTLLGRLAGARAAQGWGLGGLLLMDALRRALYASAQVASHFVLVDAQDDNAALFDQAHDFQALYEQPLRLFMPIKSVEQL